MNTVAAGTSSERSGAGTDEHQEVNPEAAVDKGDTSALPTEQGKLMRS